jgi:protocatechuate 3,4-dioxygenase beta subunit
MTRSAVLIVVGLTLFSCAKSDTAATPTATATASTSKGPASSSSLKSLAASAESCGITPDATSGPYYVSGTRALSDGDLNYDNLPGEEVKIGGYVYGADDNSDPVDGAKIEIWQADDAGAYHPQNQGPASNYSTDEISLRGYVTSDGSGYYEFSTILPGEYEGRVRHIHVKATASGRQEKIGQIIVAQPGDSISPQDDQIAGGFPQCNLITFSERDGVKAGVFNFHIE